MKINFRHDKQAQPEQDKGFNNQYAPAKRSAYKMRWYLVMALVLSPIIFIVGYYGKSLALVEANGILTFDPLVIVAQDDGQIEEVSIAKRQHVSEEEVLLRLVDESNQQKAALIKRKITRLSRDILNQSRLNLEVIDSQIAEANDHLAIQQKFADEYGGYLREGLLSLEEKSSLQTDMNTARLALYAATAKRVNELERQSAGPSIQWRTQLELDLIDVAAKQERHIIRSPMATSVSDIHVQQGQYVKKGQKLLTLSGIKKPEIHVYLDPKYLKYSHLGQTATISLPSGESLNAIVSKSTEMAKRIPAVLAGPFEGSKPALKVTLSLKEPLPNLLKVEGLPVSVRFHYLIRE